MQIDGQQACGSPSLIPQRGQAPGLSEEAYCKATDDQNDLSSNAGLPAPGLRFFDGFGSCSMRKKRSLFGFPEKHSSTRPFLLARSRHIPPRLDVLAKQAAQAIYGKDAQVESMGKRSRPKAASPRGGALTARLNANSLNLGTQHLHSWRPVPISYTDLGRRAWTRQCAARRRWRCVG